MIKVLDKHDMAENVFIESRKEAYLEKLQELRLDLKLFFWKNSKKDLSIQNQRVTME